ncbi:MAG: hypothetical protein N2690_04950, partial [Rhodocyclaceae bacterium]|nr:hypothetical protein [Rhodocyclaceae bacterium]
MNKPDKSVLFKSSVCAALMGVALIAQAAGLGKLSVYSAIGQPLNAEIALTASPEELPSLAAKLAPHSAFVEAGIEMAPLLTGLQFKLDKSVSGQPVLRVTTHAPINEPFLQFLLELYWATGRMVREYTVLLDPPEMLRVAKPVAAPAVPAAKPVAQPEAVKAVPLTSAPAAARPTAAPEYRVKPGDTLSKIAREHKAETVSLEQMLVALFDSNRDAFDGGNMNRLRAGKILRLPDGATVGQVDAAEARQVVIAQARDFNAYRRRLAEAAGAAPPAEAAARQEVTGKIEAKVETKAPAAPPKDKLEVSRTETPKSAQPAGKSGLEEELIARDRALREASERIAQLEKNIENLKKLVELKSQAGAQLQQQAEAKAPAASQAAMPKPAEAPAAKPAEAPPIAAAEAPKPAAAPQSAQAPQPEAPKPAEAAPKPAVKPPAPPPPEPSFVEENPELVFAGGGVLALLLGYAGYLAWRKRKQAKEWAELNETPSRMEPPAAARSGTVFGATSESVDSGEVSIQGDFSEGGVLTTEEIVDPVAEADVLMAYGRDSQAEEVLKEGLKTDPMRVAIHLKLLELYANRKDGKQFEQAAQSLHALTAGQGAEWQKALALAAGLGLSGGLFAALAPKSEPGGEASQPAEPAPVVAATAAPAVMTQTEEAAPAVEPGSLDFDLDLGSTSQAAEPEPVAAAQQPAAEEAISLDFDFDLGTPGVEKTAAAAEPAAPEPATEPEGIDFALDFGDMPTAAAAKEEPPAAAAPAREEIRFDLDLGSGEPSPTVEPSAPAAPPPVSYTHL